MLTHEATSQDALDRVQGDTTDRSPVYQRAFISLLIIIAASEFVSVNPPKNHQYVHS